MTSYTVQIEKKLAERLERAAHTAKISSAELIAECVTQHLDIAIRHLALAGDENQRAMLHQLHRAAVQDALGFLVKERLVEVRLGQGGYIREAPADVIVGCFDHYTSREGESRKTGARQSRSHLPASAPGLA
jgi:hypothetical protein